MDGATGKAPGVPASGLAGDDGQRQIAAGAGDDAARCVDVRRPERVREDGGGANGLTEDGETQATGRYPGLDAKGVTKMGDTARKEFYFRPSYMLRLLMSTRNFGDLKRKVKGATSFGEYLLKKRFAKARS